MNRPVILPQQNHTATGGKCKVKEPPMLDVQHWGFYLSWIFVDKYIIPQ